MPIDLGLSRVSSLLRHIGSPHIAYKTIHIAGTNGKGSVIAHLSSIFTAAKMKNGTFTSPHLLYYNDSICINNEVYPIEKFNTVSEIIKKENKLLGLNCTEFEILTVTAFKIFETENVDIAIIEVGLGGRLDATNILPPFDKEGNGGVIVTGITKIGVDHEAFLGDSKAAIAYQKAGIIKRNIPCVVDDTNDKEVLDVVTEESRNQRSPLYLASVRSTTHSFYKNSKSANTNDLNSPLNGTFQKQNLNVALKIIDLCYEQNHPEFLDDLKHQKLTSDSIESGIANTNWPGRLQKIKIPGYEESALLDGAHNESAAIELGKYIRGLRTDSKGIIFIFGATKGKNIDSILKHIVSQERDTWIPTTFSTPQNMPWVSSYNVESLIKTFEAMDLEIVTSIKDYNLDNIFEFIHRSRKLGDIRPIVVFGSLYLCSDILRWVQAREISS